jgi:hypothetical protein
MECCKESHAKDAPFFISFLKVCREGVYEYDKEIDQRRLQRGAKK